MSSVESAGRRGSPYVGIFGFQNRFEVEQALNAVPGLSASHRLMIGVSIASDVLNQRKSEFREAIPGIFSDNTRALNLIRFRAPKHYLPLFRDMDRLTTRLGGPYVHGLQLDVGWPKIDDIDTYHQVHPTMSLVLQLGQHALEQVEHSPQRLADQVASFLPGISGVVIDMGDSPTVPLDVSQLAEYLRELVDLGHGSLLGLGIAGGLGRERFSIIGGLHQEFPNLSTQAEHRLKMAMQANSLDLQEVKFYVKRHFELLQDLRVPSMTR